MVWVKKKKKKSEFCIARVLDGNETETNEDLPQEFAQFSPCNDRYV